MPKILAFAGSTRTRSYNRKLIRVGIRAAQAAGATVTELDLAEYPLPIYHGDLEADKGLPQNALRLKDLFEQHQGLLIASPEYNSGYSPLLKNTLDWVSRAGEGEKPLQSFQGKYAGLMAASMSGFGGLRGLLQMRIVLSYIKVNVLASQITISKAHEAFDENGELTNPGQIAQVQELTFELAEILRKLHG